MSRDGKDSAAVVKFMALFDELKKWCDDAPDELGDFAATDSSVNDLCAQLASAAASLRTSEGRTRQAFAVPPDPAFRAAWRDYEERYESILSHICASNLLSELDEFLGLAPGQLPNRGTGEPSRIPKADIQWTIADNEGAEQARGIEDAINFAEENANQADRWEDDPESIERIQDGIDAWEKLKEATGFDLHGVFRRRELIPFVLFPRHVSDKPGSAERLSVKTNLQQAHDAFIYGANHAALALMRSVMEAVLRDHYHAEGDTLNARIKNANARRLLPRRVNADELKRLKNLANAILHLDSEKGEGVVSMDVTRLRSMDEAQLEKWIVGFLFVLRDLIEGA